MTMHHPSKAPTLRRLTALYAGHDRNVYVLPDEPLRLRAGIAHLDAELGQSGPDVAEADRAYLDAVVDAARTGAPIPKADALAKTTTAAEVHDRRQQVMAEAMQRLDNELSAYVGDMADRILVDNLRPAHGRLWEQIATAVKRLPDAEPLTAEVVLRAGEEARTAWLDLGGLVESYTVLQDGAGALRRASAAVPEYPESLRYGEVRDLERLTAGYVITATGPRPWPADTLGRLVWLARRDADVWLPTVADADRHFYSLHREQIERLGGNRRMLGGADRVAA